MRNYKNESAESMIAREMLECVWYDNGGLTERQGQWGKFKRRLMRVFKNMPKDDYELLFIEREDDTGTMVSFPEWFSIGVDEDTRREFIREHRSFFKVEMILTDWFGEDASISIEDYLRE